VLTVAYYVVLVAVHDAWPHQVGGLFTGAMLMVPPLVAIAVLGTDPSAAAWARGADSENWTKAELRKVLGSDYQIVNDLQLNGRSNADHVVVGPAGVFVVEVKWSSAPWASPSGYDAIRSACRQAKGTARTIARLLGEHGLAVTPEPLVVLWGGGTRDWSHESSLRRVDGVSVVAGARLVMWSRSLSGAPLGRAQSDAIVAVLRGTDI
jgi:hypothetical protein